MLVQSCDKAKPGYNVIIDLPEKAKMFILLFGDIKGKHFQSLRLFGYFNGLAIHFFVKYSDKYTVFGVLFRKTFNFRLISGS